MAADSVAALVAHLGEAVAQAGQARAAMLGEAAAALVAPQSAPATLPWLRTLRFDWRYWVNRTEENRLLVAFSRRSRELVAVDARLEFSLHPLPHHGDEEVPTLAGVDTFLRVPALLSAPAATEPGVIRFNLAPPHEGMIEVAGADRGFDGATITWVQGERRFPALREAVTEVHPRHMGRGGRGLVAEKRIPHRRWAMAPFLAWLDSVRAWQEDPERGATWLRFVPPTPVTDESEAPVTVAAVAMVVGAFARVVRAAEVSTPLPDALAPLASRQHVADFNGSIRLRLDRTTLELARPGDENPILLDLHYRATRVGARARFELTHRQPDFLVAGELHHLLFESFAAGAKAGCCGAIPLGERTITFTPETFDSFFRAGRANALILRTGRSVRRETDKNLLVVRAPIDGVEVAALFTGVFEVAADQQSVARVGRIEMLRPNHDDGPHDLLRDDTVRSLFELMLSLHRWGGLLP
jgi:hypothetical protein